MCVCFHPYQFTCARRGAVQEGGRHVACAGLGEHPRDFCQQAAYVGQGREGGRGGGGVGGEVACISFPISSIVSYSFKP